MRERFAVGAPSVVPGVSFAYTFGWTLVLLFLIELVTGAALAAFYAPSTTDAWASVAYVQDRMPGGWFVRGMHVHAASALVIISGIHLLQAAIFGAYKRPREVIFLDSLPTTHLGKVDRGKLRAPLTRP